MLWFHLYFVASWTCPLIVQLRPSCYIHSSSRQSLRTIVIRSIKGNLRSQPKMWTGFLDLWQGMLHHCKQVPINLLWHEFVRPKGITCTRRSRRKWQSCSELSDILQELNCKMVQYSWTKFYAVVWSFLCKYALRMYSFYERGKK